MAVVTAPPDAPPDRLAVVDLTDGKTRWSFQPEQPQAALSNPVFSADGSRLVVGLHWAPEDDEKGVAPPPQALGLMVFDTETGRLVERVEVGACGADLNQAAAGVGLLRTVPDEPAFETDCYANDFHAPLEAVDLATGDRTLLTETPWDFVALSADGRYAAFTVDLETPTSYVVDLRTGERVMSIPPSRELGQLNGFVRALSADGSLLLYGDRPPKVFAVPSGDEVAALDQGAGEHYGASFAPTGTIAYLSGRDASLSAWDGASGKLVFRSAAAGSGTPVANSAGQVLVNDDTRRTVGLFDGAARGEAGSVATCLGFSPAGQLEIRDGVAAYTTYCDVGPTTLNTIDVPNLSVVATMEDADGQDIALAPDGRHVVSQSSPNGMMQPIRVFDTSTGLPQVTFEGQCPWRTDFFGGTRDEAGTGCQAFPATPFTHFSQRMVYSPDGRFVASMEVGPAVWDAVTGRLLSAHALPVGCDYQADECGGLGAIFTPDNSELLVSTWECELVALSTDDWTITRRVTLDESIDDCGRMALIGYLPDGTLIGMSGMGGDGGSGWLHRIDPVTLMVTSSNRAHDGSPKSHDLSPSGTRVVTGASDGVVRVWEAATGTLLHQLSVEGQAQGVAFVDDDLVAVTPSGGGMLVFDIAADSLLANVRGGIIRGFTPEECQRFGFADDCPTLEELRGAAP